MTVPALSVSGQSTSGVLQLGSLSWKSPMDFLVPMPVFLPPYSSPVARTWLRQSGNTELSLPTSPLVPGCLKSVSVSFLKNSGQAV